jgi:four helix bundle protein
VSVRMPFSDANTRAEELRQRTRAFAIDVIVLCRLFPRTVDGYVIARQLIKSATSTAANYRAACRSRSRSEFISKISLVTEESDESQFWLDVTIAAGVSRDQEGSRLLREATELTAIFTASRTTLKRGRATILAIVTITAIVAMLSLS